MRRLLPLAALAGQLLAPAAQAAPGPGSEAQRLHDAGVHCMDVIERNACAIENFEALLEVETYERELVTDAMMRLIDLYRDEGREDDIGGLLRQFWDVGMKQKAAGHMPYSARFFPTELNVLITLDVDQLAGSRVVTSLEPDAQDTLLTCDERRRKELEVKRDFRRAEEKAAEDGSNVWEVVQTEREKEAKRAAKRAKRTASADTGPIFFEALCPVARAIGLDDLRGFTKMTGALNHHDARKSIGVGIVPELQPKLETAQTEGRVLRVADNHWILPDFDYAGGPVHLLMLDLDELTIAPGPMVQGMIDARAKRKSRMNRELSKLVDLVPKDSGFFMVMTQAALREMGFGDVKRSTRSVLESLLPRPKGLQIAAVFGDHLGLFTRVPTDTPVKGRLLVSVANALVARAGDDDETQEWLSGLDIAESSDRKALLATYLISAKKLEKIMLE